VIVVVALLRDLLLEEIRSQRTRRIRAIGGYIILSSGDHSQGDSRYEGSSRGLAPALLHSSTGDVGAEGRAAVGDGRCVAVGCDGEAQSDLTRVVDTK
jgi:hypothetical protein